MKIRNLYEMPRKTPKSWADFVKSAPPWDDDVMVTAFEDASEAITRSSTVELTPEQYGEVISFDTRHWKLAQRDQKDAVPTGSGVVDNDIGRHLIPISDIARWVAHVSKLLKRPLIYADEYLLDPKELEAWGRVVV